MSWEELSNNKYPCPCGKSNYTVIIKSDDWNRLERSHSLNCSDCSKLYELGEFQKPDGDWVSSWIKKEGKIKEVKKKQVLVLGQWLDIE